LVGQHDGRGEQRAKGGRLPEKRRGNAEISKSQRAEEVHEADAEVEGRATNHGGEYGGGGPDHEQEHGKQRGGHQHGEQRQDEEIHRQGEEGDAVEVDGHGQGHGQFDDAGDDEQLDDAEQKADGPGKDAPGDAARCPAACKACGNHAQRDAELGERRASLASMAMRRRSRVAAR
jgi:hypothetical protein